MLSKKQLAKASLLLILFNLLISFNEVKSGFLQESLSIYNQQPHKIAYQKRTANYDLSLESKHPLLQGDFSYNMTWLQNQINNATDDILPVQSPRLHASIKLDKLKYLPNDVVFIEVLLFNSLNVTPVAITTLPANDQRNQFYNLTIEVRDSSSNLLFTTTAKASFSTAVTSFKLPSTISAGTYIVSALNSVVATALTQFTVINLPKDKIIVQSQFLQQSYNPGSVATGIVRVTDQNQYLINTTITSLSYFVRYSNSTSANTSIILTSTRADAIINFTIPRYLNTSSAMIIYTIRIENETFNYQQSLQINNPELIAIDAFVSTGSLVFNVPNIFYFQAYQSRENSQPLEFQNATLKQSFANKSEIVIGQVSTYSQGRGSFKYTPHRNETGLIIEISVNGQLVRRSLNLQNSQNPYSPSAEVTFSILNANRVIGNNDMLVLQFITNEQVKENDDYLLQIKLKESILYQQQLTFSPSSIRNLSVLARQFPLINGGVLNLNLYKLSEQFKNFYRNIQIQPVVNQTNGTNGNRTNNSTNSTGNSTNATANSTNNASSSNATTVVITPSFSKLQDVITWLEPKGELIIFKRPSDRLIVNITLDKTSYSPGDLVTYTIRVINSTTGRVVGLDSYVTLTAVDILGLQRENQDLLLPSSIQSRLYLSQEIANFDNENLQKLTNFETLNDPNSATTESLDLLFGLQQWRNGAFDIQNLAIISQLGKNLSLSDSQAFQGLYNYVFYRAQANQTNQTTTRAQLTLRSGEQGYQEDPKDYMVGISNPRNWLHPVRADFATVPGVQDLTQTVLFQSALVVKNGLATGKFNLNDRLSNYILSADAFNANGVLGYNYAQFGTFESFKLSMSAPEFMVVGDAIKIPVNITNLNTAAVSVVISQDLSKSAVQDFRISQLPAQNIPAGQTLRTFITATALQVNPTASLSLIANGTVARRIVISTGQVNLSIVDQIMKQKSQTRGTLIGSNARAAGPSNQFLQMNLTNDLNQSSSKYFLSVYPNLLSILEDTVQTVSEIRQGNVEQVASALYPLALKFSLLKTQSPQTSETQVQLYQLQQELENQLQAILTHRIQVDDNSRFNGNDISNEAMTAYALQFLIDISNITTVDKSLINQLAGYLISRRNGRGGFIQSFSSPLAQSVPEVTLNAYIVNVLTYHNPSVSLTIEINSLKSFVDAQLRINQGDGYILTLLAQSLFRQKRTAEATVYTDALTRLMSSDGRVVSNQTTTLSVFLSNGTNLDIETTALAIQAWNFNTVKYANQIGNATNYLISQIDRGLIGGSQGTYLGLKAIQSYFTSSGFPVINGNGSFFLKVNDVTVETISFRSNQQEAIKFDISEYIKTKGNSRIFAPGASINFNVGVQGFSLNAGQTKDFRAVLSISHRYMVNQSYVDPGPANLTTDFSVLLRNYRNLGLDNQTGRLFPIQVKFQNIFANGSAQSGQLNVILHPPSCLELDLESTYKLIEDGEINDFQVIPLSGQAVLFINSMFPGQVKNFQINYIQKYAGQCQLRDNIIYQSYGDFELYSKTTTEL
ncbi:a-macroglobulin complement component [Stylonychia lemnae]|uniref:A-macroglobulin complement component n=1 Tax=Stylonychia lemnae TaxID=5949 RepID=A0A077ZQ45_STYLE|nr:a-macroglobulin complement component [Stylonychia lemnae]|eukprot:CDW71584.1 a-macroglobulin complement component [Stylonychia lemnae]